MNHLAEEKRIICLMRTNHRVEKTRHLIEESEQYLGLTPPLVEALQNGFTKFWDLFEVYKICPIIVWKLVRFPSYENNIFKS